MKLIHTIIMLCAVFIVGCNPPPQPETEEIIPWESEETEIQLQPSLEEIPKETIPPQETELPIVIPNESLNEPPAPIVPQEEPVTPPVQPDKKIIVIDPGHGKLSSLMSDSEKANYGYTFIEGQGWGDWRHFKSGTIWQNCEGTDCNKRNPSGGSCWYPIEKGDRKIEPDINYNNALHAKEKLEELGYSVRLTRSRDENPSLSQRLKHCYPDGDITKQPDAAAFIVLHSNAGGGKGSCYVALSGDYDQLGIPENYVDIGNELGNEINNSIVQNTSLGLYSKGRYNALPELVLFCKSPIPIAYMEIGFFDNPDDLNILQNESVGIGHAIANGIHSYFSK